MVSIGLLLLRVVAGLTVAAHGAQKLFGWAGGPGIEKFGGFMESMGLKPGWMWAVAGGLLEFGGGLCVALGLLTPLAALAVMVMMLCAIGLVHWSKGFFNSEGGLEFPAVIAGGMLCLAATGGGDYSLDSLWGLTFGQPTTAIAVVLGAVGIALLTIGLTRLKGSHFRIWHHTSPQAH